MTTAAEAKKEVMRRKTVKGSNESPRSFFVPKTFHKAGALIFEQIDPPGFVEWNTETGEWRIVQKIASGESKTVKNPETKKEEDAEIVYVPLVDKTVTSGQIVLPPAPIECHSLTEILNEIEGKIGKYIYIDPDELPIFLVQLRIAVASWFLNVFDDPRIQERVAGLLAIVGTSGGGKKRWLSIVKQIAYRPISTLNTDRIPSIFRLIEPWNGTLLIDEADQKDTGSDSEWSQFLNARYDGTPIARYNAATQKNDIFRSFGLTAIAIRRMPRDEGVTSRMTVITATSSPVELPEIAGSELYDDFKEIRGKLLFLRLKYYGKLKFTGRSGLPVNRSWRVKEVLTLIRMLNQIDPEIDRDLDEISEQLTKREILNNSQTWDGLILNEIFSYITADNATPEIHNAGWYFVQTSPGKDGKEPREYPLTLKYIADKLGSTATDIQKSLRAFRIDTGRFRVGGYGARGVLLFNKPVDTDRTFYRYIPDYDGKMLKLLGIKSVSGVSGVSGHDAQGSESNNNNDNNSIHIHGDTPDTGDTDKSKQSTLDHVNNSVQDENSANSSNDQEPVKDPETVIEEEAQGVIAVLLQHGFHVNPNDTCLTIDRKSYKIAVVKPHDTGKLEDLKERMKSMGWELVNSGSMGPLFFTKPLKGGA